MMTVHTIIISTCTICIENNNSYKKGYVQYLTTVQNNPRSGVHAPLLKLTWYEGGGEAGAGFHIDKVYLPSEVLLVNFGILMGHKLDEGLLPCHSYST